MKRRKKSARSNNGGSVGRIFGPKHCEEIRNELANIPVNRDYWEIMGKAIKQFRRAANQIHDGLHSVMALRDEEISPEVRKQKERNIAHSERILVRLHELIGYAEGLRVGRSSLRLNSRGASKN